MFRCILKKNAENFNFTPLKLLFWLLLRILESFYLFFAEAVSVSVEADERKKEKSSSFSSRRLCIIRHMGEKQLIHNESSWMQIYLVFVFRCLLKIEEWKMSEKARKSVYGFLKNSTKAALESFWHSFWLLPCHDPRFVTRHFMYAWEKKLHLMLGKSSFVSENEVWLRSVEFGETLVATTAQKVWIRWPASSIVIAIDGAALTNWSLELKTDLGLDFDLYLMTF